MQNAALKTAPLLDKNGNLSKNTIYEHFKAIISGYYSLLLVVILHCEG